LNTACVHIITNDRDGVLYIGVTSDLRKRMRQQAQCPLVGLSKQHALKTLIYSENYSKA